MNNNIYLVRFKMGRGTVAKLLSRVLDSRRKMGKAKATIACQCRACLQANTHYPIAVIVVSQLLMNRFVWQAVLLGWNQTLDYLSIALCARCRAPSQFLV